MGLIAAGVLSWMAPPALAAGPGDPNRPLVVRVFHSPACQSCIKVIHDVIPDIAKKYGDRVRWEYWDISIKENYRQYLNLEKMAGKELGTPAVMVGHKVTIGIAEAVDYLDRFIGEELASPTGFVSLEDEIDLIKRFLSFGPLAILGAGLVDGVNPCAFTVIVFFVSFLSFMGYRRREMVFIGIAYILAIFLTYLAIGFGFFKALYSLQGFFMVSKAIYLAIGALSLFLGVVALNDYVIYKKTGQTEGLALQLPRPIKNKIHSIVGAYYRKDKKDQDKALGGLFASALIVGFLVSLLEAVCTGQLYLPTIVFVLKEGALRAKALTYLILYNLMFIVPLIAVFLLALTGTSSKQFEDFARRNLGLIKVAMAAVFFGLGVVLVIGVF